MVVDVGDLVSYRDEQGIVVHVSATHAVVRTVAFRSYVPVVRKEECVVLKAGCAPRDECVVKQELLDRIDAYVRTHFHVSSDDVPTGGAACKEEA